MLHSVSFFNLVTRLGFFLLAREVEVLAEAGEDMSKRLCVTHYKSLALIVMFLVEFIVCSQRKMRETVCRMLIDEVRVGFGFC